MESWWLPYWRFGWRLAVTVVCVVAVAAGLAWWRDFHFSTALFYTAGACLAAGGLLGFTPRNSRAFSLGVGGLGGTQAGAYAHAQELMMREMLDTEGAGSSRTPPGDRGGSKSLAPFAVVLLSAGAIGIAISVIAATL